MESLTVRAEGGQALAADEEQREKRHTRPERGESVLEPAQGEPHEGGKGEEGHGSQWECREYEEEPDGTPGGKAVEAAMPVKAGTSVSFYCVRDLC